VNHGVEHPRALGLADHRAGRGVAAAGQNGEDVGLR
jgi:hypothetical protein